MRGSQRLFFLNLTRVNEVKRSGDETRVSCTRCWANGAREPDVDALVFATGYDSMEPSGPLGELDRRCLRNETGQPQAGRDYRLVTSPEPPCGIYLQVGTEHTHGLTSSLLSHIAVRNGEPSTSSARRGSGRPLTAARTRRPRPAGRRPVRGEMGPRSKAGGSR